MAVFRVEKNFNYRVSTDKQVDYNENNQADIPMQRRKCHEFADKMNWIIVHEEQEDGVSGHKIRAENRDKIQIIKELARRKQFDIYSDRAAFANEYKKHCFIVRKCLLRTLWSKAFNYNKPKSISL